MPDLRSDPALLERLRAAANHRMTRAEIRAQRISWCASMSDLPRDEIARIIDRMHGEP